MSQFLMHLVGLCSGGCYPEGCAARFENASDQIHCKKIKGGAKECSLNSLYVLYSPLPPHPLRVDALRTFAVLNVLAMHKILRRNCDRDTKQLLHAKLKQFPWHMQVCLLNMGQATLSFRAFPAGVCVWL